MMKRLKIIYNTSRIGETSSEKNRFYRGEPKQSVVDTSRNETVEKIIIKVKEKKQREEIKKISNIRSS